MKQICHYFLFWKHLGIQLLLSRNDREQGQVAVDPQSDLYGILTMDRYWTRHRFSRPFIPNQNPFPSNSVRLTNTWLAFRWSPPSSCCYAAPPQDQALMSPTRSDWYPTVSVTSRPPSSRSSATPATPSLSLALLTGSFLLLLYDWLRIHERVNYVTKEMLLLSRYGKKYETVEEMKLRFAIFSENLKLIKSTNRKGLPYQLAINRNNFFVFSNNYNSV